MLIAVLELNTHKEIRNLRFELVYGKSKRSRFANEFSL